MLGILGKIDGMPLSTRVWWMYRFFRTNTSCGQTPPALIQVHWGDFRRFNSWGPPDPNTYKERVCPCPSMKKQRFPPTIRSRIRLIYRCTCQMHFAWFCLSLPCATKSEKTPSTQYAAHSIRDLIVNQDPVFASVSLRENRAVPYSIRTQRVLGGRYRAVKWRRFVTKILNFYNALTCKRIWNRSKQPLFI